LFQSLNLSLQSVLCLLGLECDLVRGHSASLNIPFRIVKSITLEAAPANADAPPSAAFDETTSAAWAAGTHFLL